MAILTPGYWEGNTMIYHDDKGEYILRRAFTTKGGKRIVAKDGKAFKIYISKKA